MPGQQDVAAWIGVEVVDREGHYIGEVEDVYVDDESGQPEWLVVWTGTLRPSRAFVPWRGATAQAGQITVGWDRRTIEAAPHIGAGDALDLEGEEELDRYYRQMPGPASAAAPDGVMIRSEERAQFGTRREESGRVRLRKYVVTEQVTREVSVSHEEIRIDREPITAGGPDRGAVLSEAEYELTLFEERPVVAKEVVAVERVRLATETVTGQETVRADVRKEQIVDETFTDQQWRQ